MSQIPTLEESRTVNFTYGAFKDGLTNVFHGFCHRIPFEWLFISSVIILHKFMG